MQNIRTANDDQTASRSGRSGTREIRRLIERMKSPTSRWSGRELPEIQFQMRRDSLWFATKVAAYTRTLCAKARYGRRWSLGARRDQALRCSN